MNNNKLVEEIVEMTDLTYTQANRIVNPTCCTMLEDILCNILYKIKYFIFKPFKKKELK